MADIEKIHKLEEEVKMLKSHLVKYRKLFMADGMIDQDELQVLDGLDTTIQKIEKEIERRVSELSWTETAQYHAENLMEGAGEVVESVVETVSETAEEVVDFVTGSEEVQDNSEEAQEQVQTPEAEENSNTENEAESSSEDTGSYPYFSHPDWENVKVSYGANAVKLNKNADRLLKSVLSSVGLQSCHVTSTIRTYADQARINYEQNSESQIKQWYGNEVHATWVRYKAEGRSTADYAAYLEERDKKRGKVLSKHLSNLCLDVTPVDSKYSNKLKELKPVSGSGVKTYLVEKGCVHTEFTFPVTGASGGSGGHGGTVMEEATSNEQQSNENTSTTDNSSNEQTQSAHTKISGSVGKGGKNDPADVELVQKLLNEVGANLTINGKLDDETQNAIVFYQKNIFNGWSDGLINLGKSTWNNLSAGKGSAVDPSADIKDQLDELIDDENQGDNGLGIGAGEDDEYLSQRDNQKMSLNVSGKKSGDSQCNVTSLGMMLIAMKGGDEEGVIDIVQKAIKAEGASYESSWGLEELLAKYTDTQNMSITSSSNMGKIAKKLLSETISETEIIEVSAKTVLDKIKNNVIPAVKKGGEVIISARFTSGGHIVFLRSIKSSGLVIHDPYGLCCATGEYLRNQDTASKSRFTNHEQLIKRRLSLNGRFDEIKQMVESGEKMPGNLGDNNFYSWDDFVAVNPYRLVITHKK